MEFGRRIAAVLGLVLMVALVAGCSGNDELVIKDVPVTPSGQAIKLVSSESGQYSPAVIKVKQGSTVRIEGDPETLSGGMDTIVVEGYGVQKLVAPGDNVLEFTADKAGEFDVRCANGMGNGKLIVEP